MFAESLMKNLSYYYHNASFRLGIIIFEPIFNCKFRQFYKIQSFCCVRRYMRLKHNGQTCPSSTCSHKKTMEKQYSGMQKCILWMSLLVHATMEVGFILVNWFSWTDRDSFCFLYCIERKKVVHSDRTDWQLDCRMDFRLMFNGMEIKWN